MSFAKDQLLPDEKLIAVTHQHPLVLLRVILLNIVAAAILIALSYAFDRYWIMLFYAVPAVVLFWEILVRQRKEYIITNRRVVKQQGVFTITSFDASLDKINNVFHEQSLMGRLFKYGNVGLETASEQGTTVFHFIPSPVKFKNLIVREREERQAGGKQGAPTARLEVPQLLEELASLRDRNIITAQEFEEKKKSLLDKIQ